MPDPLDPNVTAHADVSAASSADETAAGKSAFGGSPAHGFGPSAAPGEVGVLGPYRIVKELGRGGMGAVYAALDTRLERQLALKVMLPQFAADTAAKERFLREAKAAARVKHVNVVTVYEADERNGVPYIAMEFLEGLPLDGYLKKKGSPPIPQIVRIVAEAAAGLAAAHKLGLVHRDIKPANLWLEAPNGTVKVLDFGLARPMNAETELTQSGAVVGTPAYMSPEQARGERVDHRTDLFSLGTVLYRLCTDKLPFNGPTTMAVLMALGMDHPAPVRDANPSVPESLAQLIDQLLSKKPEQRPRDASEVVLQLRAIAQELTAPRTELSTSLPQVVRPQVYTATPVTVAPEASPFADIDAPDTEADMPESAATPAAPKPERKKGGKGLLFAVGGAVLLAAVAVAAVAWQMGKKGEPAAENKPPEPTPTAPAPPKDSGKPPPGSIPVWKPVGNEWVDVLALDEQFTQTTPGLAPWAKRQGKWTTGAHGQHSYLSLPLKATGSYNLVAEVSLDAGRELFAIQIPVGTDHPLGFDLCMGDGGGSFQGFSGVKGFHPGEEGNPARAEQKPLAPGQVVRVALTVKLAGERVELQAVVDAAPPIRWDGPVAEIRHGNPSRDRFGLFARTPQCQWTVHSLKFQKIDGEAAVLGWGPPGSDPDRKAAEWVLSVGGVVRVNDSGREIKSAADLPKGAFQLTYIFLGNMLAPDALLASLTELTALTAIDLPNTAVSDVGLTHLGKLTKLQRLNLWHTSTDDAALGVLKELKRLTDLDLGDTKVTNAGLKHIADFKALTRVNLNNTKVTDEGLAHIRGLKSLKSLGVGFTKVTDAAVLHIKELEGLDALWLDGTGVTDAGLTHLKECKDLSTLGLSLTNVTDAGLIHLAELKKLRGVNLRMTAATAKGVAELHATLPASRIEHDGGTIEPKK